MKELKNIVTDKVDEMVSDGSLEKIISDKLEETVKSSVDSAMRSYSDFGKVIEAKIKDALNGSVDAVKLPNYNKLISEIVQDQFMNVLNENSVGHLKELVERQIKPFTKSSKMSCLIQELRDGMNEVAAEAGTDSIDVQTEYHSDNAMFVTINHPEYDFQSVKVTFYNFRNEGWHIGYINEDNKKITGRAKNVASVCLSGITRILFQYYAMGTIFELDEEFEDFYYD